MRSTILFTISALSAATLLVACGGSDTVSEAAPAAATPVVATTISGAAVKGPVNGATVTIKKASDGTVVGTTTTGAGGIYTLSVPYKGDVVVEISGGTYVDEATNVTTPLAAPMKAVLTANGGSVTGVVTPLTTMAFTNAFPSASAPVSATTFNTHATNLASQFQLSGVDLTATTPTVTGTTNAYGKVLAGLSKYMQLNNVTLNTLVNPTLNGMTAGTFSGSFSSAYNTINGQQVTFAINGNTATTTVTGAGVGGGPVTVETTGTNSTVTGTGVGGGTGTCGVNVIGNISQTAQGQTFNIPVNLDVCVTGIATGSCSTSNAQLNQALAGQQGLTGAVNLNYTYSASCAAGAINIALL